MFVFDVPRSVYVHVPQGGTKHELITFLRQNGAPVSRVHVNGRVFFVELASEEAQERLLNPDTTLVFRGRPLVIKAYRPPARPLKESKSKHPGVLVVDDPADGLVESLPPGIFTLRDIVRQRKNTTLDSIRAFTYSPPLKQPREVFDALFDMFTDPKNASGIIGPVQLLRVGKSRAKWTFRLVASSSSPEPESDLPEPASPPGQRWPVVLVSQREHLAAFSHAWRSREAVGVSVHGALDIQDTYVRLVAVSVPATGDDVDHNQTSSGTVFVFDLCSPSLQGLIEASIKACLVGLIENDRVVKVMTNSRHTLAVLMKDIGGSAPEACFDAMLAYRTLCDCGILRRVYKTELATPVDVLLAFHLPVTSLFTSFVESDAFLRVARLETVHIDVVSEASRHLVPLYARMKEMFSDSIEMWSLTHAFWFARRARNGIDEIGINKTYALWFDSDDVTIAGDAELREQTVDRMVPVNLSQSSGKPHGLPGDAVESVDLIPLQKLLQVLPAPLVAELLRYFGTTRKMTETLRGFLARADTTIVELIKGEMVELKVALQKRDVEEFDAKLRAGHLHGTLHRASSNGTDTIRVRVMLARDTAVPLMRDVVAMVANEKRSVLFCGAAGCGKTTTLRNMAQELAKTRRVVAVDSVHDLGGDGKEKHATLGNAIWVPVVALQEVHIMEALNNLDADVVAVDVINDSAHVNSLIQLRRSGVALLGCATTTSIDTIHMPGVLCSRDSSGASSRFTVFDLFDVVVVVHGPQHIDVLTSPRQVWEAHSQNNGGALYSKRWQDKNMRKWVSFHAVGSTSMHAKIEDDTHWLERTRVSL